MWISEWNAGNICRLPGDDYAIYTRRGQRFQSLAILCFDSTSETLRSLVEELSRALRMDSDRLPAAGGSGSTGPAADEEGSAATAAAVRSPVGRAIPAQSR